MLTLYTMDFIITAIYFNIEREIFQYGDAIVKLAVDKNTKMTAFNAAQIDTFQSNTLPELQKCISCLNALHISEGNDQQQKVETVIENLTKKVRAYFPLLRHKFYHQCSVNWILLVSCSIWLELCDRLKQTVRKQTTQMTQ